MFQFHELLNSAAERYVRLRPVASDGLSVIEVIPGVSASMLSPLPVWGCMPPHRSTRWIALPSSSNRLLTGLFQSAWTKRCTGNRRSGEASGEAFGDRPKNPLGQLQKFSKSVVSPILFLAFACQVNRA